MQEEGTKAGLLVQGDEQGPRLCLGNGRACWSRSEQRGDIEDGQVPKGSQEDIHEVRMLEDELQEGLWDQRKSETAGQLCPEGKRWHFLQGEIKILCQASGNVETEKTTCFCKCFVGRNDKVWMCGSPCDNEPFSALCENIFPLVLQYLQDY